MPATANERLASLGIRNQVNVLRFTEGELTRIRKLLREAEIDLTRQLQAAGTDAGRFRLKDMLGAVNQFSQQVEERLYGFSQSSLTDFAKQQAGSTYTEIENQLARFADINTGAIGSSVNLTTPDFNLIAKAALSKPIQGKLLRTWWREWGAGVRSAVAQQVRLGIVENESIDSIVRRIVGTQARNYRDGILAVKRRHAEALVRTSVNHVASQAKNDVYEANSDVVTAVEWNSTLDGKTTPICQARDGKLAPTGGRDISTIPASKRLKPVTARPPAHVNCRSTILPVIGDWESLGLKTPPPSTRASLNGQVPDSLDYNDWLKTQKRPFIEGVLGKAKADLFLKGKLTLDRFVDGKGNEYSLADLRRLNPKAWKIAFGGTPKGKAPKPKKPAPKLPKFKGVPEALDASTTDGVKMERIQEILEQLPGGARQVKRLNDFVAKFKTGSIFALKSHTMNAGFHNIRQQVSDYIKKLGPAQHNFYEHKAVLKAVPVSSPFAAAYTAEAFNFVVVRVPKTAGGLKAATGKKLADDVLEKIKTFKAANTPADKGFNFAAGMDAETRAVADWLHELGHQVHFRAGKPRPPGLPSLTRYADTNHLEWYAEHFSAWVMNREALLADFPEIVEFVEAVLKKAMGGG